MAEHRAVKEVFGEAMELPVADRAAYLVRVCVCDAVLRAEVEGLLRSSGRSSIFWNP